MQEQIAVWNSARRVWENSLKENTLCEHSAPYLETWPTSGMTLNGSASKLPTPQWEPLTSDSASFSLPPEGAPMFRTPTASETDGGMIHPEKAKAKGQTPKLFPAPVAQEAAKAPAAQTAEQKAKTGQVWLTNVANTISQDNGGKLLPTSTTSEATGSGTSPKKTGGANLRTVVSLLPTPKAGDSYMGTPMTSGRPVEKSTHLATIVALQSGQLEHRREPERFLPTPVAQPSGNSPEEHLRKKPGRSIVTDLAIVTENGLLATGGRLPAPKKFLPTPNTMDVIEPREGEAIERQLRRGGEGSRRNTSGNLREDILLTVDPDRYKPKSTGEPTSLQFDDGNLI